MAIQPIESPQHADRLHLIGALKSSSQGELHVIHHRNRWTC